MSPQDKALMELRDTALKMPTPKRPEAAILPPGSYCCRGCGKLHAELEYRWHITGMITARDNLCPKCAGETARDMFMLVCLTCREVVLRMQKMSHPSGFRFEAGGFYHVDNCPSCQKLQAGEHMRNEIIELKEYQNARSS